jgi:hypothetical protein
MAGEVPIVSAAIAWDSGFSTPIASRTYTDVTPWVSLTSGIGINYGRADERSTVDPSTCTLTLNNADGRFTPEKASSPYFPNVKKGKPIQVSLRYPSHGAGNLLSVNQASMETSVADWFSNNAFGTLTPATISSSTLHPQVGTKGGLATWPTTALGSSAMTTVTGLVVGRVYTASAYVWVPTGSPDVSLGVTFGVTGAATSVKNALTRISVTFTATASGHILGPRVSSATSGQQCFFDAVMLDEGSTVGTFTTSAPPISTRFTGYVDEWPLTWPTGGDQTANMSVTCSSRRARLGKGAPLPSAIRDAYLKTTPLSYWPMDETDLLDHAGRHVFRDITNQNAVGDPAKEIIGCFAVSSALQAVLGDGTPGPTDEGSLVKLPSYSDSSLVATFPHYVGAGGVFKLDPTLGITLEVVARLDIDESAADYTVDLITLLDGSLQSAVFLEVSPFIGPSLYFEVRSVDPATGTSLSSPAGFTSLPQVTDGEIHHYAFTLDSTATVGKAYVDGVLIDTKTLSSPIVQTMSQFTLGRETYHATAWVGHAAVHNRALTAAEMLTRANAATATTETIGERVQRLAGYLGVPASEVSVETSVAAVVGSQPQLGRAASEVGDELAVSTGGILYDTRAGLLAMQARNHRYNQTSAFTLSAANQEIENDLTPVLDDRYIVNSATVSHTGSDELPRTASDATSIADYGLYSESRDMVTTSAEEIASAAAYIVGRYAQPKLRVSTVSVDVVDLSASQQVFVLGADIGTLFTIAGLPAQAPSSSLALYLEGYSESISAGGHTLTMNTTPGGSDPNVLVLDDAAHDVLDSGVALAY